MKITIPSKQIGYRPRVDVRTTGKHVTLPELEIIIPDKNIEVFIWFLEYIYSRILDNSISRIPEDIYEANRNRPWSLASYLRQNLGFIKSLFSDRRELTTSVLSLVQSMETGLWGDLNDYLINKDIRCTLFDYKRTQKLWLCHIITYLRNIKADLDEQFLVWSNDLDWQC